MFEISKNISINLEIFNNSKIYIIDNFYENPDNVLNFFLSGKTPDLLKKHEISSVNGIYFEDRRHEIISDEIVKVYEFLSFLCEQEPLNKKLITTNAIRFKKCEFNDYNNNYWWPHQDQGYNGIVYFNINDEISGTNLYENFDEEYSLEKNKEHVLPWKSKDKYKIIKSFMPKYNRLVLFDGFKFIHGMNICNDNYFDEGYRFNQVFFFKQHFQI